MNIINKLFKKDVVERLEKENSSLKSEIEEYVKKLVKCQDVINKTNAYWKKKFFEKKNKTNSKL